MEEEKYLEFKFSYTDEFGQHFAYSSKLTQANLEQGNSELELELEQFKQFLLAQGHSPENVNKINFIE